MGEELALKYVRYLHPENSMTFVVYALAMVAIFGWVMHVYVENEEAGLRLYHDYLRNPESPEVMERMRENPNVYQRYVLKDPGYQVRNASGPSGTQGPGFLSMAFLVFGGIILIRMLW